MVTFWKNLPVEKRLVILIGICTTALFLSIWNITVPFGLKIMRNVKGVHHAKQEIKEATHWESITVKLESLNEELRSSLHNAETSIGVKAGSRRIIPEKVKIDTHRKEKYFQESTPHRMVVWVTAGAKWRQINTTPQIVRTVCILAGLN